MNATGNGGDTYLYIISSPKDRLIGRLTGTDANSIGFANWDQTNGEYASGAGTLSHKSW